jgi:hypothetical protein
MEHRDMRRNDQPSMGRKTDISQTCSVLGDKELCFRAARKETFIYGAPLRDILSAGVC